MTFESFYNTDCRRYTVDLPYPSVAVRGYNIYYATLLSGAFAGPGSETTALTQYTAHNFYTTEYPAVTEAYKCILAVEYIHLNLLGDLIRALGLYPKFLTYETGRFWSGSYPVYAYHIVPILKADIDGEYAAVAHYKRLIAQIGEPEIQALLERIIIDEEKHIEILSYFADELQKQSTMK